MDCWMNKTNDGRTDGLTKGQSQTIRQSDSQTVRYADVEYHMERFEQNNRRYRNKGRQKDSRPELMKEGKEEFKKKKPMHTTI